MTTEPTVILLVAVNARYSHCSFAARTLQANLGKLADKSAIFEADLEITPMQLATEIVRRHPLIVGFTVYLWNVRLIEATARILHAVAPDMRLAAGGPEITADYTNASLYDMALTGEGESTFRLFCSEQLHQRLQPHLAKHITRCPPEDPATLVLPYDLYTDIDLKQRTVYAETSRGCPYSCAYCTSADTGLRLIPLERLLPALDRLWERGLRRFKFIDRSFNAPVEHALKVLDHFLQKATPSTRLHFEINAERMHQSIAEKIALFPKDTLHLEVGIQTLHPQAATLAGRSADTGRKLANLRFLTHDTGATVHADLIFGLPGEDAGTFAQGFNRLIAECAPPEVQVNLLKGLPGTLFHREAEHFGLVFNPEPPYELLRSNDLDFTDVSHLQDFSRCWELVHNRGRFPNCVDTIRHLCAPDFFGAYQALAGRIQNAEGKMFALSMPRMALHLRQHLIEHCGLPPPQAEKIVTDDLNCRKPK